MFDRGTSPSWLVDESVPESDFVEFKRELNVRDPKWRDELRADAAGLASAGTGFLLIGVDESRDGRSVATGWGGVDAAASIKASVEDSVGSSISPPIALREARLLPASRGNRSIVALRVEGRKGCPYAVDDLDGRTRYFVREAGKKRPLSSEDARQRREALTQRLAWRRAWRTLVPLSALAAVVLAVPSTLSILSWRERAAADSFVDPALQPRHWRTSGSMISLEGPLFDALGQIGSALGNKDVVLCTGGSARVSRLYPGFVGRAYLEGTCAELAGDATRARAAFERSAELAGIALTDFPRRWAYRMLRALSFIKAGNSEDGCRLLQEALPDTPAKYDDELLPTVFESAPCPGMSLGAELARYAAQAGSTR